MQQMTMIYSVVGIEKDLNETTRYFKIGAEMRYSELI